MKVFKALFVALLLLLLPACLSWFMEKPTFNLKEISINRISLSDINFLIGIEVQNPNSFDLNLRVPGVHRVLQREGGGKRPPG